MEAVETDANPGHSDSALRVSLVLLKLFPLIILLTETHNIGECCQKYLIFIMHFELIFDCGAFKSLSLWLKYFSNPYIQLPMWGSDP